MANLLGVKQKLLKQEIHGLQRGLRQLEKEIGRNVEEIKDLVIKINTNSRGSRSPKSQG